MAVSSSSPDLHIFYILGFSPTIHPRDPYVYIYIYISVYIDIYFLLFFSLCLLFGFIPAPLTSPYAPREPHQTTVRPRLACVYEFSGDLGFRLYTFDFPPLVEISSILSLRLPLHLSLKSVETIRGCAQCRSHGTRRESPNISWNIRQPDASFVSMARSNIRGCGDCLFIWIETRVSRGEYHSEICTRNRKIISSRIDMSEATVTADACLKELGNKVSGKRCS